MDGNPTFGRGDVIARKYEIENHLGGGQLGVTYLARHIASGKHLVMKFVRNSGADPAKLEEHIARVKAVRHPGLIRFGEVSNHNELPFLTVEYFNGQSLRQLMDEYIGAGQVFTLSEACTIMIQILQALQAGHEAGLVHRNLTPDNVLVQTQRSGPGGKNLVRKIKVTDMGLADLLDVGLGDDDAGTRRMMGGFSAAGPYIAPELSGFGSRGTAQADIFSVGVIFYELLVGQTPRGTFLSPTQLRDDLPTHVDNIVELALSPNPEERYPAANDMVADIQRSFDPDIQASSGPQTFRNVLAGIGIGVGLVGLAGFYITFTEPTDPVAEAKSRDETIRQQLAQDNPPPSEAEMKAMQAMHPDMRYVPAGTFVMGRLEHEDEFMASASEPFRKITHTDGFFIDRYEFPNRKSEAPVAKANWGSAEQACVQVGKRLCSALEWEKACKGPPNYIYGYNSDIWDPQFCGDDVDDVYTLGSRPDCVSGYGVFDMSGGKREWVADSKPNKESRRLVKGGLRGNAERGTRCAFTVDEDQYYADATLGFRCCLDLDAPADAAEPAAGE